MFCLMCSGDVVSETGYGNNVSSVNSLFNLATKCMIKVILL